MQPQGVGAKIDVSQYLQQQLDLKSVAPKKRPLGPPPSPPPAAGHRLPGLGRSPRGRARGRHFVFEP
ncbi:hypothetical protein EYF80_031963 [Liparis tanakae]|uniref:Uncharacterized protein n=1 Tax=Liparis tanakae TaxID=230148 RepID=A0A4Z2GWE8_9TELE|nr:hypothetical protein EYF80_031963 [Liparis tanakae]